MSVLSGAARFLRSPLLLALLASPAIGQVPRSAPADSSSLSRAIARLTMAARASDPTLRAARARELAAERRMAGTGFAPPLVAVLGVSDGPGGDLARGNASLEVGRELFRGSRLAAARAVAAGELEIESRERRVAETVVEVRVTDLLLHGAAASRAVARLRQSERLLADAEEALTVRLAAGSGRYADVLRVRTERLTVGFSIRDENANLATARAQLSAMTPGGLAGDSLDVWIGATAASLTGDSAWRPTLIALPPMDSLMALAEAVRDAAAARMRAVSRRAEGVAARRAALSGAVGIQRIGEANGGPSTGVIVGISSTLPFTARRASGLAAQAEDAEIVAAEAGLSAAAGRTRPALDALRARLAVAISRLDAIDGVVLVAAESEREAALAEFRAGSLSLLELLDFERALLRVELERSDALREAAGLRASLFGITPFESGVRP